jgi:hypothetical protein
MDNFNEGLESFDEDGFKKFHEEFRKEFKGMEDDLKKLSDNINELKGNMVEAGENMDDFNEALSEIAKEEGLIDEEAEMLEYLKDRFFLIGLDNYNAFAKLVSKEIPDYKDNYSVFGFALSDLEDLNDKFKEYDITAFFIKYELMVEASMKVDTERLFSFEPIKGGERKGILIPVQCDLNKDKPERYSTIDEIDVNILGSKLDAFNKGEISFEDFLGSV